MAIGAAPDEAADDADEAADDDDFDAELAALDDDFEAELEPEELSLDIAPAALLETLEARELAALEAELSAEEIELEMLAMLEESVALDKRLEPADSIELVTEARDDAIDDPALDADSTAPLEVED